MFKSGTKCFKLPLTRKFAKEMSSYQKFLKQQMLKNKSKLVKTISGSFPAHASTKIETGERNLNNKFNNLYSIPIVKISKTEFKNAFVWGGLLI